MIVKDKQQINYGLHATRPTLLVIRYCTLDFRSNYSDFDQKLVKMITFHQIKIVKSLNGTIYLNNKLKTKMCHSQQ